MTLDDWMRSGDPQPDGAGAIFISACQAIWGADPNAAVAALRAAVHGRRRQREDRRVASCASSPRGGGAQERRFVGGSQVVSQKVADRAGQARRAAAPVRVVAQDRDGVRVVADGIDRRRRAA